MLMRTDPPECTPLGFGQTIEASLAPNDRTSTIRTGSHADCYTFSAAADDQIVVSMTSGEFDTYLYLMDPSGEVIAFNDDGGGGTDSRIPEAGGVAILATGVYSIEATSFFSDRTGTYLLTLQRADALSSSITVPAPKGKTKPDPYSRSAKGPSGKPFQKGMPQK